MHLLLYVKHNKIQSVSTKDETKNTQKERIIEGRESKQKHFPTRNINLKNRTKDIKEQARLSGVAQDKISTFVSFHDNNLVNLFAIFFFYVATNTMFLTFQIIWTPPSLR